MLRLVPTTIGRLRWKENIIRRSNNIFWLVSVSNNNSFNLCRDFSQTSNNGIKDSINNETKTSTNNETKVNTNDETKSSINDETKSVTHDETKTDTFYEKYFAKRYDEYGKNIRDFSNDLNAILEEFEKKKYDKTRIKYFAAMIGTLFLFMFWRTIKSFLSKETSDVAIRTMNDEEFQKQMYSTLLKTLKDASNDENVAIMLADLINKALIIVAKDERTTKLLHDEDFIKILTSVASITASEVIKSEQVKKDLDELAAKEIETQLKDKENKKMLSETFYDAACSALKKLRPW